jgi:hypothetical protein
MEGDDPFGHSGDEFGAGSSDTGSSSSGAPEEVGWPSSGLPFTYSESDGHARPWEQVRSRAGKALPFERLRGRFMRPSCWTHDVDRAND